jgi:hypothetical protein
MGKSIFRNNCYFYRLDALGGTIGLATIIFAFGVGPAVSLGSIS